MVSIHGDLTDGSPNQEALSVEFPKLLNIGLRRFVLNLEPVSTMDSDGINEIIKAHKLVTDRDGELTFRGSVTVPVHGQLTIGSDSKRTIESKLSGLMDIGLRSFVLDLENVSNVDSSGMADIVKLYKEVADRGGHLDPVNLPRQIRDILEITKVAKIFDRRSGPGAPGLKSTQDPETLK